MAAVAVALGTALVPLAVRNLESAVDAMKQAIVRSRQKPSTHTHPTTVGQKLSNWWHRPAIEAAQARAEAAALQAAAATILASAPPEAGLAAAAPLSPFTDPPISFTTTLAPLFPKSNAYSLPSPFPAPVTIATLPSNLNSLILIL